MRTRILLVLACVVSAIGLVKSGSSLYATRQTPDLGEVIPQPNHWVSFEATITRTMEDGTKLSGRFYRGSDGSDLRIDDPVNPSAERIRKINNYSSGRYYHSNKSGEWISGPLVFTGPRKIPIFRTKALGGLRLYDRKLALLDGQDGSLWGVEGLEAWVNTTQSGSVYLLAPALNFYPVASVRINGFRQVLSDIKIGPMPDSLFEPPAGEDVTFVNETYPRAGKIPNPENR